MNYLPHTIAAAAICVTFKQWLSSASVANKYNVKLKSCLVSKHGESPNWQGAGFVSPAPGNEQNVHCSHRPMAREKYPLNKFLVAAFLIFFINRTSQIYSKNNISVHILSLTLFLAPNAGWVSRERFTAVSWLNVWYKEANHDLKQIAYFDCL